MLAALAAENVQARVVKLAVSGMPRSGSPKDTMAHAGIDAAAIVKAARELAAAN